MKTNRMCRTWWVPILAIAAWWLTPSCGQAGNLLTSPYESGACGSSDVGCGDGCGECELPCDCPWFIQARVGGSVFDSAPDTKMGATYGLDFALPLAGQAGLLHSMTANHYSGGSQYFATTGVYKLSLPHQMWQHRVGYLLTYDQFTDTQASDLYAAQTRYQLDYRISQQLGAGVFWIDPLVGDRVRFAGRPGLVPFSTSNFVSAFVDLYGGDWNAQVGLGYRDAANASVWSGSYRRVLSEQISLSTNASYQDDGVWTAGVGLEFKLGQQSRNRSPWRTAARQRATELPVAVRATSPEVLLVRAQSGTDSDGRPRNIVDLNDPTLFEGQLVDRYFRRVDPPEEDETNEGSVDGAGESMMGWSAYRNRGPFIGPPKNPINPYDRPGLIVIGLVELQRARGMLINTSSGITPGGPSHP